MRRASVAALAVAMLLCGCDKVVSVRDAADPTFEQQVDSCMKLDFCIHTGIGFDAQGHSTMTSTFSYGLCPTGEQTVVVRVNHERVTHKSGKISYEDRTTWIKDIGGCQ